MPDNFSKVTSATKIDENDILAKYPLDGKCADKFNPVNQSEVSYYKVSTFILDENELELTIINNADMAAGYITIYTPLHKYRNDLNNGFWWIKNNL